MTTMQKSRLKSLRVKVQKSIRDASIEVKDDMTVGEKMCVVQGIGVAGAMVLSNVITNAIGWTTGVVLSTKVLVVGGVGVAVGAVSKAAVRGFSEGWKHEARRQLINA